MLLFLIIYFSEKVYTCCNFICLDLKQLRSEINKEISKLYSYVNYHSFALDKVFMDIWLDTKDSKKEVFKIFMSNKVKEMSIHVDEDALMQHIDDIFNKNYTMKDSISEVQKVFSNISKICKLKEADTMKLFIIKNI